MNIVQKELQKVLILDKLDLTYSNQKIIQSRFFKQILYLAKSII